MTSNGMEEGETESLNEGVIDWGRSLWRKPFSNSHSPASQRLVGEDFGAGSAFGIPSP